MTKDEFIEKYSRFGHRTDARYDYYRANPTFSRWNLDKVRAYFDAVPCDCGHQECKGWKMRANSKVRPEDCSIDPMTMFGPLGPPFTMLDSEEPTIAFTSSDDETQPVEGEWKHLADVKPVGGQLVEYRGVNPECARKEYTFINTIPKQGHFVVDCGTHWTENLNGFTTEKRGVICAPDPEITLWRAVIDRGKDMILNSEHCVPTLSARSEDRDTVRGDGDLPSSSEVEAFMSANSGPISSGVKAEMPSWSFKEPDTGIAEPKESNYTFIEEGKEVGRLWADEEGHLRFEGQLDRSVQILMQAMLNKFQA